MCEPIALKFALTGCIGKKRLFTELVVRGQKESVIDDISLCRDRQTVQLILVTVAIKIAILHLEDVRNHCLIVYLCPFQHHDIRVIRVKCGETRALRKTALSCVAGVQGRGRAGRGSIVFATLVILCDVSTSSSLRDSVWLRSAEQSLLFGPQICTACFKTTFKPKGKRTERETAWSLEHPTGD
jgi:hypothetical protein